MTDSLFRRAYSQALLVIDSVEPRMAEATRRKIYDMLVAEKMLVQGFHYPFPAVARIEKAGDGYREVPALWNPTMSP